jgi:hypothetical protein
MPRVVTLALAVLALACGGGDPDAKLAKSLDAPATAMAAAAMTGQKFVANSVPRAFVENSLESVSKAFEKTAKQTDKSGASAPLQQRVHALLGEAQDAVATMQHAVETDDRQRVLDAARRLETLGKQMTEESQRQ